MDFILTSPMLSPMNTIMSPYYSIVTVDTPTSMGPIRVDSPYSPGMILLDSPSLLSSSYLDIPVVSIDGYPYNSSSSDFIVTMDPYSPTVTDILIDSPMMYDSPYVSSIDLTYSMPLVGVYENPNQDPDLIRRMTEYYYYKMLDQWLYNSMREVLEYLDIKGSSRDIDDDRSGRIMSRGRGRGSTKSKSKKRKQRGGEMSVIPRKTASTKDNDTTDTVEVKARYIQKHIFTKDDMKKFLNMFIREVHINWYDIPKKERALRMDLEDELIKRIKRKAGAKEEDL